MITQRIINWCRSHDWGRNAYLTERGTVAGLLASVVKSDGHGGRVVTEEGAEFSDVEALRDWAGY